MPPKTIAPNRPFPTGSALIHWCAGVLYHRVKFSCACVILSFDLFYRRNICGIWNLVTILVPKQSISLHQSMPMLHWYVSCNLYNRAQWFIENIADFFHLVLPEMSAETAIHCTASAAWFLVCLRRALLSVFLCVRVTQSHVLLSMSLTRKQVEWAFQLDFDHRGDGIKRRFGHVNPQHAGQVYPGCAAQFTKRQWLSLNRNRLNVVPNTLDCN